VKAKVVTKFGTINLQAQVFADEKTGVNVVEVRRRKGKNNGYVISFVCVADD